MNLFSKTKFKAARFVETGDELRNPERGWYQIHTFVLSDDITMVDREYTLNNLDTVALLLIDIGAYKNKSLDSDAISKLRMRWIISFRVLRMRSKTRERSPICAILYSAQSI